MVSREGIMILPYFKYKDERLFRWQEVSLESNSDIEGLLGRLSAGAALSEVSQRHFSSPDFWQKIGFVEGRFYTRRAVDVEGEYFFSGTEPYHIGPMVISSRFVHSREDLQETLRDGRISIADRYHIERVLKSKPDINRFFALQTSYCDLFALSKEIIVLTPEQLR